MFINRQKTFKDSFYAGYVWSAKTLLFNQWYYYCKKVSIPCGSVRERKGKCTLRIDRSTCVAPYWSWNSDQRDAFIRIVMSALDIPEEGYDSVSERTPLSLAVIPSDYILSLEGVQREKAHTVMTELLSLLKKCTPLY